MPLTFEEAKEIIGKVPPAEMDMPALVIDEKTSTWKEVLAEIEEESALAQKMLIKIEEMRKNGNEN